MSEINERANVITIGGEEYELLLTTAATKEIGKRYGGLAELGEKMTQSSDFEDGLSTVCDLICLLANQSIRRYNLMNPQTKREELTPEKLELLTEPWELQEFNSAIGEAVKRGTKRFVRSEDDPKNVQDE